MLPANIGLIDSLRFGAYLVAAELTVYQGGNPTTFQVPVSTCQVTVDRNSEFRRQGTITVEVLPTVPPQEITPISPNSILSPFGSEVFIQLGIQSSTQPISYTPLGLFTIATSEVDDTGTDMVVSLTVYDRAWVIAQRQLVQPWDFPQTTSNNLVAELELLIQTTWDEGVNAASLNFNIAPSSFIVPSAIYDQGSDPWQACLDLADAAGYELFFDVNGVCTGFPTPNPNSQPQVWTFTIDSATALGLANGSILPSAGLGGGEALASSPYTVPTAIASILTRDGIQNDFFVTGSGSQNATGSTSGSTVQYQAEASDTNPSSPTWIDGPMGDVPNFDSSNFALSNAQAQAMANNDLYNNISKAWTISVSSTPNPLFDIDDVVGADNPRMGLSGQLYVVDTIQTTIRYDDQVVVSGRVFGAVS